MREAPTPIPAAAFDHPIDGVGLGPSRTLGGLLDQHHGPTLLVFLRHHG